MIDQFYKIQQLSIFKNFKYGIYMFLSFFVNVIMIIYYRMTFHKHRLEKATHGAGEREEIIVSLTSFPGRIDQIWICIESIFRQSMKPDKIILWLADSQFSDINSVPERIKAQQKKGLTIRLCDDLRSHKKYYYAFKEYPEDIIITLDDDVYYPTNTVEKLVKMNREYPECICCNRGHLIKYKTNGQVASYKQWLKGKESIFYPSLQICPTGVGGVLYPPNSVDKEVFNKKSIKDLCFFADDLWLKAMSLKANTKVMKTMSFPDPLFTVRSSQKESLAKVNVIQDKNDEQFKAILEMYSSEMLIEKVILENKRD